jgi:hypothetical protein
LSLLVADCCVSLAGISWWLLVIAVVLCFAGPL